MMDVCKNKNSTASYAENVLNIVFVYFTLQYNKIFLFVNEISIDTICSYVTGKA